MPYLLGTDEAGYGPNLGPLVISATLWKIPRNVAGDQLYSVLPSIRPTPGDVSDPQSQIVMGDSKHLYRPSGDMAVLETAVLAAFQCSTRQNAAGPPELAGPPALTWRRFLTTAAPASAHELEQIPWYQSYDTHLPVDASADQIIATKDRLDAILSEAQIQLVAMRSTLIFPEQFNRQVGDCGKSNALSLWTFELIRQLIEDVGDEPILILCDKHGARNHYAALLQHTFSDCFIQVRQESKLQSVYRWGPSARRIEARFTAKGERYLATALASMDAKYLRELAMKAFNRYWQSVVPNLRRTAGYPVDARRFLADIERAKEVHAIPDIQLWRNW